jgi:hypothetical protein
MPLSTIFMLFHEFQFYEENECSETCLNRTFVGQTFVFGIDRCSVYKNIQWLRYVHKVD